MFAAGMTKRGLLVLVSMGLVACQVTACSVYDGDLLTPMSAGKGGKGGGGAGRAGNAGGSAGDGPEACVAAAETCNDVDDDCDGTRDNTEAANADCSVRYHAKVTCSRGFCLFIPATTQCDPGWYHCDGQPENGCETQTPCGKDLEPGDDGGADDSGI